MCHSFCDIDVRYLVLLLLFVLNKMLILDYTAILLISMNIIQMVSILFLLLPIFDVITLSKYIKQYKEILRDRPLFRTFTVIYCTIIAVYGILGPTRTLNKYKMPKFVKDNETPEQKVLRIIDSTNAIRNYLLSGFSLCFVLVIWRSLDLIIFSAKLHELYDLMRNYDLIDITLTTEVEEKRDNESYLIDETIYEDDNVHWPSIIELNKTEYNRIQAFLRDTAKKPEAGNKVTKDIEESQSQNVEHKNQHCECNN